MSTTIATRVSAQAAAESPATPTVTHYQEMAEKLSAAIAALPALVPDFQLSHPATEKLVRANRGVPNDFITTVLSAVESDPQLQGVNKFDVVEARDALQYNEAFRPVIDQAAAFVKNLKFSGAAKKAPVVAKGLQLYAIAKGIGRDAGSASVTAHSQNMKRDLKHPGFRRPKQSGSSRAPKAPQTKQ